MTDNIREAALRYEIEHPVVNDAKMAIWRRYGARSWPTLVLIDPAGDVVWAASGEREFEEIKAVIDRGLPYYRAQGLLKPAPRPKLLERQASGDDALRFPGKVLADGASGRLFIADSNHNRIVVARSMESCSMSSAAARLAEPMAASRRAASIIRKAWRWSATCCTWPTRRIICCGRSISTAKSVTTVAGTGEKGSAWAGVLGENRDSLNLGAAKEPRTPTYDAARESVGAVAAWERFVHRDGGHASDLEDAAR